MNMTQKLFELTPGRLTSLCTHHKKYPGLGQKYKKNMEKWRFSNEFQRGRIVFKIS